MARWRIGGGPANLVRDAMDGTAAERAAWRALVRARWAQHPNPDQLAVLDKAIAALPRGATRDAFEVAARQVADERRERAARDAKPAKSNNVMPFLPVRARRPRTR